MLFGSYPDAQNILVFYLKVFFLMLIFNIFKSGNMSFRKESKSMKETYIQLRISATYLNNAYNYLVQFVQFNL